ncbi:MAG TPA: class I SAM-dependent methyltransferase [Pirellulales bacterium]|nr:class I SAM-dependent methyltransferase [Pirellulales bacterium]
MSLAADLRTLYHLTLAPIRGTSHAERLESFYAPQAAAYDRFRERLLHGRQELFGAVPFVSGSRWVDLGGGTAANLLYLGDRLAELERVFVVDLSASLLAVAKGRVAERGWSNVELVCADASRFEAPSGQVDVVSCSYSLTMMPDWFAVMDRAWELLKPGGIIAVVDFFVSRKYAADNTAQHGWWSRHFWPAWFGRDNVYLSPDHIPYLQRRFTTLSLVQQHAPVPYLPGLRVPYYRFLGRKPTEGAPPAA